MEAPSDRPLVLVVYADAADGTRVADALVDRLPVRVRTVETVAEAIPVLETSTVACVVSEATLPDGDGVDFLETVREGWGDLPFVVYAAEGSEQIASRAIDANVTAYVVRGAGENDRERLVDRVERAIADPPPGQRIGDEHRVGSVVDAMPDVVAILRDGVVQYLNDAGVAMLGLADRDAAVGRRFSTLFAGETPEADERALAVQRGDAVLETTIASLVDAAGTEVPVSVTLSGADWQGAPAAVAVVTDRTLERTLERRLARTASFDALIREINHLIIGAESRAAIEGETCERFAASDRYRMAWIAGYDAESEAVVPRAAAGEGTDYVEDLGISVDDEERTGQGPTGRAIRSRETQVVTDIATDETYGPWRETALAHGFAASVAVPIVADDTLYGVLNLYASETPTFDDEEVTILEMLGGDIAFANRALEERAELEHSEERLSLALTAANAGVWDWLIDEETIVWDENNERLFGIEPGSFEGTYEAFASRVHPDDRPTVESDIELALAETDRFTTEFRIQREDGAERWLAGRGTVLRDDDGEPRRILGVDVDITGRKERERHLHVVDRVLRHNLRNDVNVIAGNADLIADQATGEVASLAAAIEARSRDLLEKADKEREVVGVLTERAPRRPIDVAALARETATAVETAVPDAAITVAGAERALALGTEDVGRAIAELVENAVHHSDRSTPSVTVRVERGEDRVEVTVADDGPTIPEMNIGVLTGREEDPLYHGSGMGLWLVHLIVQRAGGTLAFGENEPRGNRVTIRLPVAESPTPRSLRR